jgi:hypothetical protein
VANKEIDSQLSKFTSDLLTTLQQSEEAQEGMKAFLESETRFGRKRKINSMKRNISKVLVANVVRLP